MTGMDDGDSPTRIAKDGLPVILREIGPEDGPLLEELFRALSPRSIYNRFLAPIRELDGNRIHALTHLDPCVEFAVTACRVIDGRERMLGVGRCHRVGAEEAELAIVVGDPWQRLGIGRLVLQRMVRRARELGIRWFLSTVDPNNHPLLRFSEAVGFRGDLRYHGGLLWMQTDVQALFPGEEAWRERTPRA
ncbi:GNAT family N-acetyltransferase [Myxococcota bacterium]|nr:GNAT family N-acetyltransferase [Myxococcota bacterium]